MAQTPAAARMERENFFSWLRLNARSFLVECIVSTRSNAEAEALLYCVLTKEELIEIVLRFSDHLGQLAQEELGLTHTAIARGVGVSNYKHWRVKRAAGDTRKELLQILARTARRTRDTLHVPRGLSSALRQSDRTEP